MELALLVARLLLASVFALAGLTKVLDRPGTRKAVLGFGVPRELAGVVAAVLPLAEFGASVLLILTATAWWGALAALGLLSAFAAALGYQLARGRTPQCHCFGQVSKEPIGWPTLVRNVVLSAPAVFVLAAGPGGTGELGGRQADYLDVMTTLLVAVGGISVILWRQQEQLAQRLRELDADEPADETAPGFHLPDLSGDTVTLDDLVSKGRPVLLLFSNPGCAACEALLPQIGEWQHEYADTLTIVLISRGAADANRSKGTPATILLQHDNEVAEAYGVPGTPCAVLVHPDGTLNGPAACGENEIRNLVAQASGPQPEEPVMPVGTAAPSFLLPDLDGRLVTLDEPQTGPTLLLFWDPNCGHCAAMLPDLRGWEGTASERLLVISTGDAEANRALGLSSQVLLDEDFATGRAFGIGGTPMAVLVDEQGKIASPIAAGAPAIWDLVERPRAGSISASR